ncbi:PadR family transcriptional regulator [Bacillus salitolerans]|uniref:PadR family transcriptional regulator n=1 Tax=Bacillus salitolerans TaxID=1437434 RepID=A0ABW4LIY8_9BACI
MSVEYSILSVLSSRPCSGYDIKAEFEHKAASLYWGMSFGSIYPRLKKLEQEGLIKTINEESGGRQKKLYDLTGKGWLELENWLRKPSAQKVVRDELLVKMISWESTLPDERQTFIEHLRVRKYETEEMLKYLEQWPENDYSFISEYGMLAIKYGQKMLKVELDWIEEAIEQLQGPAKSPKQDQFSLYPKMNERRELALSELDKNMRNNE